MKPIKRFEIPEIPEEVKTTVEKWAIPLAAGGMVGFGAYTLAKESPTLYGIGAGVVVAILLTR